MPLLHISLQDGFSNEAVVLSANGKEVFNKESVSTRQQIGVAAAVEFEVAEGSVDILVRLPLRNVSERLELNVRSTLWLGISLANDGRLTHRASAKPFNYI